jgi:hypothetical protein
MSPSVMTLPARNFKFLTEGSLERTRNYRLCEKKRRVEIGAVPPGVPFPDPADQTGCAILRDRLSDKVIYVFAHGR